MTDRLLELAALWGVETHALDASEHYVSRPDLELAHDLRAKLPLRKGKDYEWGLYAVDGGWCWYWEARGKERESGITDFESAVIALAERAKP